MRWEFHLRGSREKGKTYPVSTPNGYVFFLAMRLFHPITIHLQANPPQTAANSMDTHAPYFSLGEGFHT